MNHIHVTCAIIERDGLVLAPQRNATTSMPLKWEFPGGKINTGETAEECLRRELFEELGVRVCIRRKLLASTYAYRAFTITLYPFVCTLESGVITLHEHTAITWLPAHKLYSLDWAEADLPVLEA